MATTYGLDIAHYQKGLDLGNARTQGYSFCMAKVTEGIGYSDPEYAVFRDASQRNGLLFSAYHFLRSDSDGAAQGRYAVSKLGDKTIPLMVDVESGSGNSKPTASHIRGFLNGVSSAGGRVTLMYLPHWYWQQIGSPSLSGFPALVASNYVSGSGYASKLYPGNTSARWNSYGGLVPTILQFSSSGLYSSYKGKIDVNAFRGTEDELKALGLFKNWGSEVSTIDDVIKHLDYDRKVLSNIQVAINNLPDDTTKKILAAIGTVDPDVTNEQIASALRAVLGDRAPTIGKILSGTNSVS